MDDISQYVTELPNEASVYQISDSPIPAKEMVPKLKSYHADKNGVPYNDIVARTISQNLLKGHMIVAIVDMGEIEHDTS